MKDAVVDLTQTYLHFTDGHGIERYQADPQFWADVTSEKLRHVPCGRVGRLGIRDPGR
ncbi:MAG TPA: hypothetical protein VFG64_16505 [Dongiaceae bacterium]|nr:hypothetical protein [Dongiaceae bacterium]